MDEFLREVPALTGKVVIPYDINSRTSFSMSDYDKQREFMYTLVTAMEDGFLGFELLTYNLANLAEHID